MIIPTGTDIKIEAVHKHGAKMPEQVPGVHLWIVVGIWAVSEPKGQDKYHLDLENLLSLEGPGCFWCEEPWTPTLAANPCRGDG